MKESELDKDAFVNVFEFLVMNKQYSHKALQFMQRYAPFRLFIQ